MIFDSSEARSILQKSGLSWENLYASNTFNHIKHFMKEADNLFVCVSGFVCLVVLQSPEREGMLNRHKSRIGLECLLWTYLPFSANGVAILQGAGCGMRSAGHVLFPLPDFGFEP